MEKCSPSSLIENDFSRLPDFTFARLNLDRFFIIGMHSFLSLEFSALAKRAEKNVNGLSVINLWVAEAKFACDDFDK